MLWEANGSFRGGPECWREHGQCKLLMRLQVAKTLLGTVLQVPHVLLWRRACLHTVCSPRRTAAKPRGDRQIICERGFNAAQYLALAWVLMAAFRQRCCENREHKTKQSRQTCSLPRKAAYNRFLLRNADKCHWNGMAETAPTSLQETVGPHPLQGAISCSGQASG